MSIKLTIIGSGSAVPTLKRGVSSQFLNFNERRILIDCGEGTQMQLRKFKVKFQRLNYIFISHLHGDHFLGIFGLLSSMSLLGRTSKLVIYAPAELKEIIQHQFNITKVYLGFELEFVDLKGESKQLILEDRIMQVFSFPLKHRIETYGFLFVEKSKEPKVDPEKIKLHDLTIDEIKELKRGHDVLRENELIKNQECILPKEPLKQFAYCSDTMYLEQLSEWVQGVDLLYHEATFTEKYRKQAKSTMHSTAGDAARIAKKAGVQKLILGHFSARFKDTQPVFEEAKSIYENVTCVEDGDEFII